MSSRPRSVLLALQEVDDPSLLLRLVLAVKRLGAPVHAVEPASMAALADLGAEHLVTSGGEPADAVVVTDGETVAGADPQALVFPDGPPTVAAQNDLVLSGWDLTEVAFDPSQVITTGSNFMTGNGYLGYRGTFPEWRADAYVGCVVTDTYDCADGKWRELATVPNGLYARWAAGAEDLGVDAAGTPWLDDYRRGLTFRYGLTHRTYTRRLADGTNVRLRDERFASYDDLHLLPMRLTVEVDEPTELTLTTGIDGDVWSLNGQHLAGCSPAVRDGVLLTTASTVESGVDLAVAQSVAVRAGEVVAEEIEVEGRSTWRHTRVRAVPGVPVTVDVAMAVWTANDGPDDPAAAAIASVTRAAGATYDRLLAQHIGVWDGIWDRTDVEIDGDLTAQTLVRYSLFHNVIANPAHAEHLPIGARGLSCQAYQGAAFWDQEVFNLPMFLDTDPEQARRILTYRYRTLDGARRKARRLGYRGAYYAWISGETGDELCPDFFFVDVLSGRPIRNHFNDWQMHVSPDIATTIHAYERATGDRDFVARYGAEMLFEIARFLVSFVWLKPTSGTYHTVRLLGPDEYHENVDDNAFTNHQVRAALAYAVEVHDRLRTQDREALDAVADRIALTDEEVDQWRDVRDRLWLPAPDPRTGLIEQFAGYFDLEDTTPDVLRGRLQDPGEYWGWPNGVAVHTQVIKQADVVQFLLMHPSRFSREVMAANYDYYLPRTQHGSSLSPSAYATVAAWLGREDDAMELFHTAATIDAFARESRTSGGTFIGGIRTAAAGAVWQVVTRGFAGYTFDGEQVSLDPHLPSRWERLTFSVEVRGRRLRISLAPGRVTVRQTGGAEGGLPVSVAGQQGRTALGEPMIFEVATR